MKFTQTKVNLDDLLLDPNNYRFLNNRKFKKKLITRFHEENVQKATLTSLRLEQEYQLEELKSSILTNGFVPIEQIIVTPYKYQTGKFVVVEGNRRVAALKSLLLDAEEGVLSLTDEQKAEYNEIPAAILEAEGSDLLTAERIIMGIRHVTGPREWGAYQQAHLVLELKDEENKEFRSIADHLGLSPVEAARRYRAMKALKTMENDELYSTSFDPAYYRLFHELVSQPEVRERFGWSQEEGKFNDIHRAREFFELIAPNTKGVDAKLRTYSDVRKLKSIVGKPEGEVKLFDPEESLASAISTSEPREAGSEAKLLSAEMSRLQRFLTNVTLDGIKNMTAEDVRLMSEVRELINRRLEEYGKLCQ